MNIGDHVRIDFVDMTGFAKRDFPPTELDHGLIVKIVEIDNESPVVTDTLDTATCYTCVTSDKRMLQLMSHEISLYEYASRSRISSFPPGSADTISSAIKKYCECFPF